MARSLRCGRLRLCRYREGDYPTFPNSSPRRKLEALLDGGAHTNATDMNRATSLHIAAYKGYADVVQVMPKAVLFICLTNRFTGSY